MLLAISMKEFELINACNSMTGRIIRIKRTYLFRFILDFGISRNRNISKNSPFIRVVINDRKINKFSCFLEILDFPYASLKINAMYKNANDKFMQSAESDIPS